MKLELVTRREVSYVELQRDKKHSLGLTMTDGTQEDARPVIKNVSINGPAAKSCAIAKGDVVLSVNGVSTTGKKSKDVRRMLDDAGSDVNLQVLYKTHETRILGTCVYRKQQLNLRLQKIKGSFGFLLRKCSKYSFIMEYPIISNIKEGSPVQKDGHLQDGDRLLMIGNVSLSWMSLTYIASLLQKTDEAEFTFEYNVGIVNFAEMDTKVDLEINASIVDLGISFRMCDEECLMMYISNIQQGSVAERCGIFSEGDVVLAINDIDKKHLTISRANFLLRNGEKNRKLSFISNRRNGAENINNNIGHSSTENTVTTDSFLSNIQTQNWKHFNTPASSNFMFGGHQKYNFQSSTYSEQIQSIDKFQSIFSIMSCLKQALSALTRQAFGGTQIYLNQNCTSCNDTKHAVKLCTSCLAKMNVKCAQSMDVMRELVAHFVKFSSNMIDVNDDQTFHVSLRNVIHLLRETLPNILRVPELQEHLVILSEKIARAGTSCNTCDIEVKNVMMVAKQLSLILSARDNSVEFTDLAEHLVCCLLDAKFPCCRETENIVPSNNPEKNSSSFENLSETVCIGIDEELFSDTSSNHLKNNSETESNQISLESNINTLQDTDIYNDYLKLTHIQSVSESKKSVSPKSVSESYRLRETRTKDSTTIPKETIAETSFTSFFSEDMNEGRVKKFFKSIKIPKIWKSLDSLVKLKRPSDTQTSNQATYNQCDTSDSNTVNKNQSSPTIHINKDMALDKNVNSLTINESKTPFSCKRNKNAPQTLYNQCKTSAGGHAVHSNTANQPNQSNQSVNNSQKHLLPNNASSQEGGSIVNGKSTSSSSIYAAEASSSIKVKKTYPETMILTLKKEGDGFGLGIGNKTSSELPVIEAIEPKSPSHKVGVLKLGDRIFAINGIRMSKLSTKQFFLLKNKAFAAATINLTVEFDVYDEKYLFGSFDVVLDRTLKIGLIFEDMKKSSPMVISGIAKGSAAHRSGQLFPGDEITFFKCTKNEEFDPLTCSYNKEENVIITIMRDPRKVLGVKETARNPSPCYTNPCFHHEESVPQGGQDFVVKKTAVRSSRKNSLVVDHEVTLYRDSLMFDFGILLGEDSASGRAYISDIRPDGPAHKSGVIKKLDRIIEVNGVLVDRNVENSVLELLSRASHQVDLLIRRVYHEELSEI